MGTALVEYDIGHVIVEFEYHAELIAELKAEVEVSDRSWNPNRKAWVFTPHGWTIAEKIIDKYFTILD